MTTTVNNVFVHTTDEPHIEETAGTVWLILRPLSIALDMPDPLAWARSLVVQLERLDDGPDFPPSGEVGNDGSREMAART